VKKKHQGKMVADVEKLTYSVEEAAAALGIGRGLCYEMARDGRLPALRLGAKRLVIPVVALQRMLSEVGQRETR